MRQSLISLAVWVLLPLVAAAAQDPLPDEVAELYVAYQQAEQSGDLAATLEAADAVYRAARRARVDDVTLGALAENLGYYASASQDFKRAYDAWRDAAERADDNAMAAGYRWQNASVAAYRLGDHNDARRCAMNASEDFAEVETLPTEALNIAIQAHVFAAQLNAERGSISASGRAAQRALDLFAQVERPYDRFTALSYFYVGLDDLTDEDFLEAAVKLHIAHDLFRVLESGEDEIGTAAALSSYSRRRLLRQISMNSENRRYQARAEEFDDEMEAALAANPLHQQLAHLNPEEEEDVILPDGAIDAVPARRNPPRYPSDAASRGIEGFIALRFTVEADGSTSGVEVIYSAPSGYFDEAAIGAITNWRYEPATIDGVAVRREGVETQFNFELAN